MAKFATCRHEAEAVCRNWRKSLTVTNYSAEKCFCSSSRLVCTMSSTAKSLSRIYFRAPATIVTVVVKEAVRTIEKYHIIFKENQKDDVSLYK